MLTRSGSCTNSLAGNTETRSPTKKMKKVVGKLCIGCVVIDYTLKTITDNPRILLELLLPLANLYGSRNCFRGIVPRDVSVLLSNLWANVRPGLQLQCNRSHKATLFFGRRWSGAKLWRCLGPSPSSPVCHCQLTIPKK